MDLALSARPVSRRFRDELEAELGLAPTYATLTSLRRLPPLRLVELLRATSGRCLLLVEEGTTEPLVPVLEAIAILSAATTIEVVRPELRTEHVSRWRAARALVGLAVASADGALTVRRRRREVRRLLAEPRVDARRGTSRRRLLFLNANLSFGLQAGGSVGHIAGVVNGLTRAGYEVTLAQVGTSPALEPSVRQMRLRTLSGLGFPPEVNGYRFQTHVVRQVERLLAGGDFGVLYQRLSAADFAGVVLSRRLELPLVVEYNGSEAWAARHWGRPLRHHQLALDCEQTMLRHAHVVVTVSDVLRADLLARGVDERRIVCHPNAFDPAQFDPGAFDAEARDRLRSGLEIPADALVFAFIGTFGRWHGVEVLARAIERLANDEAAWLERHEVHFLLVGDGDRMDEVQAVLGAEARRFTTLTGLVLQPEAPAYLAIADAFVSPHVPNPDGSPFFGSPTKLFEYMAMERPIVASDLGQIGSILRPAIRAGAAPSGEPRAGDPHRAVLVLPGDVDDLIRGIRFLTEHPNWRSSLARRAREHALAHFTWDHHVAAILATFDTVVAEH
jgi:glycosyltransferase involved in cell wall biosynthesis